jgi:hypothetical protein
VLRGGVPSLAAAHRRSRPGNACLLRRARARAMCLRSNTANARSWHLFVSHRGPSSHRTALERAAAQPVIPADCLRQPLNSNVGRLAKHHAIRPIQSQLTHRTAGCCSVLCEIPQRLIAGHALATHACFGARALEQCAFVSNWQTHVPGIFIQPSCSVVAPHCVEITRPPNRAFKRTAFGSRLTPRWASR